VKRSGIPVNCKADVNEFSQHAKLDTAFSVEGLLNGKLIDLIGELLFPQIL
jgi:hypothetical protein